MVVGIEEVSDDNDEEVLEVFRGWCCERRGFDEDEEVGSELLWSMRVAMVVGGADDVVVNVVDAANEDDEVDDEVWDCCCSCC